MLLAIAGPELGAFLHHIIHSLIHVVISYLGIFRDQDSDKFLRSPELSEIIESFLDADFSKLHAVDIHDDEMEAFFILLPQHIARREILMQNFLVVHICGKTCQRLSQLFVGTRGCITHFVKGMQVVTLQGDEIGISQESDGITLFDERNRRRGPMPFFSNIIGYSKARSPLGFLMPRE